MKTEADPNTIVYFNNQYVPLRTRRVSILTHAFHYGTGVFDGIRGYWDDQEQELFLMRPMDHFQRWKRIADPAHRRPANASVLCDIALHLIRAQRIPIATSISGRWPTSPPSASASIPTTSDAFSVIALPFGDYLDSQGGCMPAWSPGGAWKTTPFPAAPKSAESYVNSALAGDEARRNGFDEAIFLTEAAMWPKAPAAIFSWCAAAS